MAQTKEEKAQNSREYYRKNKEKIQKKRKKDRKDNIEASREKEQAYRKKNKESINQSSKKYRENNKDEVRKSKKKCDSKTFDKRKMYSESYKDRRSELHKERMSIDPEYAMICRIRKRTSKAVRDLHIEKTGSTLKYLGCDSKTLLEWLQDSGKKFDVDFDITNYDSDKFHVDHKKSFEDVSKGIYTLEEVAHYTNLQILPAEENLRKGGTSW